MSLRHVGFVETGRAAPSREMVLRLAAALDVPSREQNLLLAAAGYAARHGEASLDDGEMTAIRTALELAMQKQMPYPAWVLDATWTPRLANEVQQRLLALIRQELGGLPEKDLLFHPDGLRRCLANWHELATMALRRLRREIALGHTRSEALLERCRAYPGVPESWQHDAATETTQPVVRVMLELAGARLEFVTTLATFGTAVDVTGQELRIESYYPADATTEEFCRRRLA